LAAQTSCGVEVPPVVTRTDDSADPLTTSSLELDVDDCTPRRA
jgi:hypothetical protein